jgi:hypothetical protein
MNLKRFKLPLSTTEGEKQMTYTILAQKPDLRIAIVPIDELKPHEKGSPLYLKLIRKELLNEGVLKYPIVADEKTLVILDGMHRWLALKSLGYTHIPTILTNVHQNPRIRIGRRRINRYTDDASSKITIEEVISAALSGQLMQPKSTRHFFSFSKFQQINYPLRLLGCRGPQDVSKYLAKITDKECSVAFEDWLKEISEELEFLTRRKEEVEKEMNEFLNRVKNLDNDVYVL